VKMLVWAWAIWVELTSRRHGSNLTNEFYSQRESFSILGIGVQSSQSQREIGNLTGFQRSGTIDLRLRKLLCDGCHLSENHNLRNTYCHDECGSGMINGVRRLAKYNSLFQKVSIIYFLIPHFGQFYPSLRSALSAES
jgi:hypothetical protein